MNVDDPRQRKAYLLRRMRLLSLPQLEEVAVHYAPEDATERAELIERLLTRDDDHSPLHVDDMRKKLEVTPTEVLRNMLHNFPTQEPA